MQPLVSIIIPTYNRAHLIGETLESVLAQTYQNWECIVVDDGSTDNTETLLQTYIHKDPRFQYHKRPGVMPKGGNSCRNFGFEVSKGMYIIFLDSDDLLIPNTLQNRITHIDNENIDMLISLSGVFKLKIGDTDKQWNTIDKNIAATNSLIRFLKADMPWQTTGVTWSRDFFIKSGGAWHPTLKAWQDWELHCRALINQPNLKAIVEVDNYYRYFTDDGIANAYKSKDYLKAMASAIITISHLLTRDKKYYQNMKVHLEVLIFSMLIKRPVSLKYFTLPYHFMTKIPFKSAGLSRLKFIKIYIIEILSRSTKIRKYVLGNYYKKQQRFLTLQTTHLK